MLILGLNGLKEVIKSRCHHSLIYNCYKIANQVFTNAQSLKLTVKTVVTLIKLC